VLTVRRYRPADRAAVRRICADTALYGGPIEPVFPDRELVADALLAHFLESEPESCFVVEESGEVLGYLVGAVDGREEWRFFLRRTVPRVVLRVLVRLHWLRPAFWRLLLAGARVAPARRRAMAAAQRPGVTATLHVNLDERARSQDAGSRLLEAFVAHARERGAGGIAVSVATDGGKAFFAKHGFARLAAHPAPRLAPGGQQPDEVWIMWRAV
jgi:ribosomal protein S18 acetylase RimI-like enzyme